MKRWPPPVALGCVGGAQPRSPPHAARPKAQRTEILHEQAKSPPSQERALGAAEPAVRNGCLAREHRCLPANYGRRRRRGEWVRTLGSQCQLVSIERQTAASHKGLGRRDRLVPRPRPGFWCQDQGHPARKVKSWDMSAADSASRVLRKRLCGAFLAAQR